jgi:type IV pilus assembly protein PilV
MRTHKNQAGVMLIEALIGILIFSIGILALLGMQGAAIKNTTDAKYRSEAASLASQIVGQMWVDIKQLDSYKTTGGPAVYPARDAWVTKVAATLPGGITPQIEVGADPVAGLADREVRVTVQWRQPGDVQTDVVRQFVILNRIHEGSGV